MAKLAIVSNIDVYCDKCCTPLEAYQDPQTHDLSVTPCKGCIEKFEKAIKRLVKKMEVAA